MRRYRIVHTTGLGYDGPVRAAHNELRMTPLNEPGQTTLENRIRIRPLTWSHVYRDHWGTHVMAMESLSEHQRLDIEAISTVERTEVPAAEATCTWDTVRDAAVQDRLYEWLMVSERTRPGEGVEALVEDVRGLPTPRAAADEVCRRVREEMEYRPGATGVHGRGEDAWADRAGVCQDFAHITVGALRALGIPARYVSGYLVPTRDLAVGDSASGESHAWVEFWDDAWVAADPTNGTPVGVEHVVVARGRDYDDVPPFKGIYSGRASAALDVAVTITRLA
ncbi:transglutaminase family protein [Phycicoccus sonneratiae]|uniref:Transglutaminase family protein n=1 Tax=Phycicoccus sonneratiae TaxID=2807628 RepID=A0ABS2CGF5_9MICO|nr:transglutaminase family protein [Phycicoccus sonneraticus]MBM6398948.1 transglutaminase family protein [Phycicoccus sonneraticus]